MSYIPIYNNPLAGTIESNPIPDYGKYLAIGELNVKHPNRVGPLVLETISVLETPRIEDLLVYKEDELPNIYVLPQYGTASYVALDYCPPVESVPEPASLLLFAIGISGLIKKLRN